MAIQGHSASPPSAVRVADERQTSGGQAEDRCSLTGMTPVGQYAYSIGFSDGHASGIYTLEYLRELGGQAG